MELELEPDNGFHFINVDDFEWINESNAMLVGGKSAEYEQNVCLWYKIA